MSILKNIWQSILNDANTMKMRYRTQEVPKGEHGTKIHQRFLFPIRAKSMTIKGFMYGDGLRYEIGSDQTDLNKYGGLYFQKYRPHGRTTMLTWYYNPDLDKNYWTFYHHGISNIGEYQKVGSVPGYIKKDNFLLTEVGKVPNYHIKIVDRYTVELAAEYKGKVITDKITFAFPIDKWITEANVWHGGQQPAQGEIEVKKARTRYNFKPGDNI